MKNDKPTKLLWIDLEMTGLDPQRDQIIEVAAIVTDWEFTELATIDQIVKHEEDEIRELIDANAWWTEQPAARDELLGKITSGEPLETIEKNLLKLIADHIGDEPVVLAGNSIHQDRLFIRRWLPNLEAKLHYRMLDVSSWKIVMMGKFNQEFEKASTHRAMEDIRESIAELKFYLQRVNGS